MNGNWVMTARKVIRVPRATPGVHPFATVEWIEKVYDVGDPAPSGHEDRPYTRLIGGERIESPAPNRMLDMSTAKKRGRPRKAEK